MSNTQYANPSIGSTVDEENPTVTSILNNFNFDSKRLSKPLSDIPVEYIFTEDQPNVRPSGGFFPSRGLADDLCYGTGTAYIAGLSAGGAWGLYQGSRVPVEIPSTKLQLNQMLNYCTRRGPFVANSVGVVAMFYNVFNYTLNNFRRGENDTLTISTGSKVMDESVISVIAAGTAGGLFKATAGIRPAATSSLLCASVALLWSACKSFKDLTSVFSRGGASV